VFELSGGQVEAGSHSASAVDEDPCLAECSDVQLMMEILPAARLESILPAWKDLSAESLDDNPFLSPAFLLPMIQHDLAPSDLVAVLVWQTVGEARRLVGLLPLRPTVRSGAESLFSFSAREAHVWAHDWQPVSLPLLAADESIARLALSTILKAIANLRNRPSLLCLGAVPADSQLHAMLVASSSALGLGISFSDVRPPTLGLDYRPTETAVTHATLESAMDASTIPGMLERILVLEVEAGHEPLIDNPSAVGFVRSMVRGLAAEGRLILALTPDGPEALGAIVVRSRARAWIWRLVGQGVGNPSAEAHLIGQIERQLGLPVSPVNGRRLTGIGLDIERLHALRVELRRAPLGFARRIGGRFSRSAAPLSPVSQTGSAAA
jgi:hypothetical protein